MLFAIYSIYAHLERDHILENGTGNDCQGVGENSSLGNKQSVYKEGMQNILANRTVFDRHCILNIIMH